jgi:hypothetical protein
MSPASFNSDGESKMEISDGSSARLAAKGLLLLVCGAMITWAQSTSDIHGTVRDPSGAAVPGAIVRVTQTNTGTVRGVSTDPNGSYVLTNLPLGPYQLETSKDGFTKYVQTGIVLQVSSSPTVDVTLAVGSVAEQVQVQANAVMVETRTTSVGQVIQNQQILDLPLNGRQATDLIVLTGASVQTATSNNRALQNEPAIAVAGGLSYGTTYLLDGVMHNDAYNSLSLPFPFPDALQEFKVETSTLTAQNGIHSGASINSVTKSGTNSLHGDAFEFLRNDLFNARNYFATTNSTLKRNQFGGTLGGKIIRDKLFFFGGYQETTLRQDPANTRANIPTATMLTGDFTAFASAACQGGKAVTLKAPFVGNKIPVSLLNPAALEIAGKLPQTSDPCGLVTFGTRNKENDYQGIGRVDYQKSAKQMMFGRYLVTQAEIPQPYTLTPGNLLTANASGFDNLAQSVTLGDTLLFGQTVNSLRLAVNRTAVARLGASTFAAPSLGINVFSYLPNYMPLTIAGGFSIDPGTSSNSTFRTTAYEISDDVSLVRGSHQIAFGGILSLIRSNSNANVRSAPNFTFDGTATGLGLADFLAGALDTFVQSSPNILYAQQWYAGLYAQDSWKALPRLTINYGVRWEPWFPEEETNGTIYNFDMSRFLNGTKSTVFTNAPAGLYFPGDPGFPGKTGIHKRWWDFGPRVGLAWDPTGTGKLSIRAGYGLAYDFQPIQWNLNTAVAPPWGSQITIPSPVGGFLNPWQGVSGGNPYPLKFNRNALFTQYGVFTSTPYNIKPTGVSSWNLTVQRQFGSNWLASASYLGREAIHIWTLQGINVGQFLGTGPCTIAGVAYTTCSANSNLNQRRLLSLINPQAGQYYGALDRFDDGGTQSYNGLLLSLERRLSRGVSVTSNYTWSHCIGDPNNGGVGPNAGTGYVNPSNREMDRGSCDSDRRNNFNLILVGASPGFGAGWFHAISTNWLLSAIYRYNSGAWLTALAGTDRALSGISNQRPNQVLSHVYGNGSLTGYLNINAFALPALGTLGNMGHNDILGPDFWQFDLGLSRSFRVREGQRVEVRAEAFNVLNGLRKGAPNLGLNAPTTFGQITTALDPRIMQFAMKYVF